MGRRLESGEELELLLLFAFLLDFGEHDRVDRCRRSGNGRLGGGSGRLCHRLLLPITGRCPAGTGEHQDCGKRRGGRQELRFCLLFDEGTGDKPILPENLASISVTGKGPPDHNVARATRRGALDRLDVRAVLTQAGP